MATPPDAFADNPSLAAQMRPALIKYFKRKAGSAVDAEDLAQDVLVRALTHPGWKTPAQAKGYIFRIAVNRWRDLRRRRQTHGVSVEWNEEAEKKIGVESSPECVLIRREELLQVVEVLDGLSERTRTVLMLMKLEQMTAATVADILGISASAVTKHLAQAMERLGKLRRRQSWL